MMKSRVVIVICLLTLSALSFCDYPTLNSISDLIREVSKGSVPIHATILLHWFANNSDMDNNDHLCISFNPNQDFGSHYYGNRETLLEKIDNNVFSYFTVGSINRPLSGSLPDYFRNIQFTKEDGKNVDRIILCTSRVPQDTGSYCVNQAYLTRHFQNQRNTAYDPNRTFIIGNNLLHQLRQFESNNNVPSMDQLRNLRNQFNNNINDDQLWDLRNTWRNEARLGLLLLIVSPGSYPKATKLFTKCNPKSRFSRDLTVNLRCEWQSCEKEDFRVTAGDDGYARICWRNVPQENLKDGVAVVLFKNQNDEATRITYKGITSSQGSYSTSALMNEGLQVRLHKKTIWWLTDEICKGEEFKSTSTALVDGNVELQLFVRDGKACFRLYVEDGGYDYIYKNYYYHWVGLYSNRWEDTSNYLTRQWQWVIKFNQGQKIDMYDTFEYCTSTTITTGLQARIIEEDCKYNFEHSRTEVWSFPGC